MPRMSPEDPAVRVVVVDDHPFILKVLGDALAGSGELDLAGVFETGQAALDQIPRLAPDVVVIDHNLRDSVSGLDVMAQLIAAGSPARFLVFSAEGEGPLAERARDLGAAGTVSKHTRLDDLVAEILRVGRA